MMNDELSDKRSAADYLKFILPSLLGVLIFLTPVKFADKHTIVMGVILDWIRVPLEAFNVEIILFVATVSAIGSGYFLLLKPKWESSRPLLFAICQASPYWFFLRTLGALVGWSVYLQIGPEIVWAQDTGYMVYTVIGPAIVFTVAVACFLMPMLTDFGFLEFVGVMVRKPFKVLFNLPGRAAVDATSSIVTASVVGLLITVKQYEEGHYTAREAAAVATNFSIVSLPFSLVVAKTAGLDHMFFTWYLTVIVACLLCAVIMVRIPPLVRIKDDYYLHAEKPRDALTKQNASLFREGLSLAVRQAANTPALGKIINNSMKTAVTTIANVTGPGMIVATFAAILAFHTPVFEIISWPIFQLLELFSLPEAQKAAPGFIVGFFDQFTPAIIATSIENEKVRFILAGFSMSQLIYMADYGIFVLRSSLPINFRDLLIIFILRTLILFPIFLTAGYLLLP